MKKELGQNWHFFYIGWIFHILTILLIAFLENLLIDWSRYPRGLPDYANAMQNLFFRFPIWFFGTAILTTLVFLVFFRRLTISTRIILIILNGVVVALGCTLLFFTPFVFYQETIIIASVVILLFMLIVYFLRKKRLSGPKNRLIYSSKA